MPESCIPIATYRLQFNSDFRFLDAVALVDYLAKLGISDIYASPLLTSRKGSTHGYDATDSTQLDPDIGTTHDFEQLQEAMTRRGLCMVLDIVPNHMAASSENRWWMDVLENGEASGFASYFDIDWYPPSRHLEGKVLLPVLGKPFGEVLDRGELKIVLEDGRFFVRYFDAVFPITTRSYRRFLKHRMEDLKHMLSEDSPAYQEYAGIIAALSAFSENARSEAERRVQADSIRERLQRLLAVNPDIATFLNSNVSEFNGTPGDAASMSALESLLAEQKYLLAYWQDPNEGINYRRFFAISELVGIRAEDPIVFEATHGQILNLLTHDVVRGVRVDHIDGLRDPVGYLNRLQERLALSKAESPCKPYVVVEKILAADETLPDDWQVSGTTGYEYLNLANGIFVNPAGARQLEQGYFKFIGKEVNFADVVYEKKKLIMATLLRVEMRSLGRQMANLASRDRYARNLLRPELMDALIEVTACLPVYRTYIRNLEVPTVARTLVETAVTEAKRRRPRLSRDCFDFVRDVLTLANPPNVQPQHREERLTFVMRWQQFTGPITAKGVEDTALYVYYPLLSLNEVGGNPEPSRVVAREAFYQFIEDRLKHWPDALNATSTHDTKRSEDLRARLNVLSEIPGLYADEITAWAKENERYKQSLEDRSVPDANEEYLIYQSLVGLWPTHAEQLPQISERLRAFVTKALREALVHSSWMEPNNAYEEAIAAFIKNILSPHDNKNFLDGVARLVEKVYHAGMINGLSQALLKIACPGVPDFYQGSELWDFHLVDPDNRCPVDYQSRIEALASVAEHADGSTLANEAMSKPQDGRLKLFTICKALSCRREQPDLFREGEFLPLNVVGERAAHVIAFLRRRDREFALTVIPRWVAELPQVSEKSQDFWKDTCLHLPEDSPTSWRSAFTSRVVYGRTSDGALCLSVDDALKDFPVALLTPNKSRN